MNMTQAIIIGGAVLFVIAAIITFNSELTHEYKRFTWDGEKCKTYYEDCTCTGELLVLESYPPQYICNGIEHCNDMNITECR